MSGKKFNKSIIATSITLVLGASSIPMVMAAEKAKVEKDIEIIQVTGIRGSTQASINTKRFADSQVDGISAEDIGKLPDVTITDSLQRISGVQIERTAGEGGAVAIRGLPQVDTTMNGEVFLSATTIDKSSADLGDLPAQLFSGVDVFKSTTATNTANGIAGAIDLKTRRPFELDEGFTFSGGAEVIDGSITDSTDSNINGLINYNAETWGFLVAAVTTDLTLASDFNGHNDTSEDGGYGWTGDSQTTWDQEGLSPQARRTIVPHGFTAFNKEEERKRDAYQFSFQADLGDGFQLVADYFYTQQDRFNSRQGFNHNSRWSPYAGYATATGFTGDTWQDDDGNTWEGANVFAAQPKRMQTFTQTNANEEVSKNFNLELNYDNGGALTGQVRVTSARANASMRHGYGEGDILSIDNGSDIIGPGGFNPAEYCTNGEEIIGDKGGCNAQYSQGIEDGDFLLTHDASGEFPVFSGFDQMVNGGKGMRSVADYLADKDSYHIGAFSSEGNTDDKAEMSTFSTKWNYALEDNAFITSVDFGVRLSQRSVDHDQFSYTSDFGGCDIAQWKAVDQTYEGAAADLEKGTASGPCHQVEGTGENVNGVWTPYTLLPPTPIDQHATVSLQSNFGNVRGIPAIWSIDPSNFRDTRAFQEKTFGNVARTENGGATYDVALDEITYFLQANFEYADLSGNIGMKVIESDLYVKQNLAGPNIAHSGLGPDIGDAVTERSYNDYLPSVNLAYALTQDVILRGAWSQNVQPLDLAAWGEGKTVGTAYDDSCNCMRVKEGTLLGNPDLDPWESENLSLSAEWYVGGASMAYLAYYNIDIESFPVSDTVWLDEPDADGIKRGPWPFKANVQGNGGDVSGYEVGAKIAFSDFIDVTVLNNIGMDMNYTYNDSSQDDKGVNGEDLPFIGMSEDTYNFILWYEQEEFSMRIAYNARSPRLIESGGVQGLGLYQDDYAQLDVNATYNWNEHVSFYVNGANITEEYQQVYIEFPEQKAFQNVYEARWTLGTRVVF